jgi:S1-C subfamily serine protease
MFHNKGLLNITGLYCSILQLLSFGFQVLASEPLLAQNISTYEQSVVMILAVNQEYDFATPWKKGPMGRGVGSGFIIDGNRILTNAHNVANQRYLEVKKQNLAQRYPAQVEFVGHDCDLAVITVLDTSFFADTVPLQFGPLPKMNSTVQTCGFPMGGRQISMTKGVVSRLETNTYSHSQASRHLVVQTDAAINPGNSGGPVLQNGKVVGVAFQGITVAENIGYMIPTTIITHFLTDIEDGSYDGFGRLGVSLYPGLHNPAYKQFLKIPEEIDGVVVTDVLINSTTYGLLQKNDVLVQIDDFNIDNDGRVVMDGLSLEMTEILDRKQIGQTVTVTYFRQGSQMQQDLTIAKNDQVVPWNRLYDIKPDYRVVAGLTFVQLNRNYLESWGTNWLTDVPFSLRYMFMRSGQLNDSPERKEYVVLSEILPDEVNAYLGGYKNQIVETVNNFEINSLADLDKYFAMDLDGYWIIKFLQNDAPLVIDSENAKARNSIILEQYQVPDTIDLEKQ